MKNFDFFQSFIGSEQASFLFSGAVPVDASNNSDGSSREYELFKQIYNERRNNPRPWGLVSWKFNHKNTIPIERFLEYAEEKLNSGYECVAINPMIGNEAIFWNVWEQGGIALKKMQTVIKFFELQMADSVDIRALHGSDHFCFCNYFIATPKFWRGYFKFVDQVCESLDQQTRQGTEVGKVWQGSADYIPDDSATMRPFIIERLLSSYFKLLKKTDFIIFRHHEESYRQKFGEKLGNVVYQLSLLKNSSNLAHFEKWKRLRSAFAKDRLFRATVALDDPSNLLLGINSRYI